MNHFKTSDFHLASTLVTLGFKLDIIDHPPNRKAEFLFIRDDGLDTTIESFWRGDLRIEPRLFCTNQKMLKSRLYS